ncbi:cell division protein FtsA [Clostridium sp. cel8]|uniref:cell division protein FtsA n=1 Tax=Clostridium sp. cel8 TaxID=2663123 RepID=UPI0015F3D7BE|nr:cell division protein FtsA [Clostridium sp. cel8]MBA5850552.1 cell division protein FtsA [Clostridium sp. cel8]
MNEYIIGIDVGSSNICAAAGKLDKYGEMQIMGITSSECTGVKKEVVIDIDSTSESIKKCVYDLERMIDIKIEEAYISLPGGLSELVETKGVVAVSSEDGEVKESDVRRVLKAAKIMTIPNDKEIIGVLPEQYIIDGYDKIKDPVGMSGTRLEVDAQVILAQSSVINNFFKSVNKAGIKVLGLVFEPTAISQVVLKNEQIQRGVVLVDVGGDSISIYNYDSGKLSNMETVFIGGNSITNDISVCLKLPVSSAESLKKKYSCVGQVSKSESFNIEVNTDYNNKVQVDYNILLQIIDARVEELLYIIDNKIRSFSNYENISEIVLVGGGLSQIKGIREFSENILNKQVRIGVPNYIGASSSIYVTAVGVVKDVSNSMKGKYEKVVNEYNERNSGDYEKLKNKNTEFNNGNYENGGFVSKIKEFFTDFF